MLVLYVRQAGEKNTECISNVESVSIGLPGMPPQSVWVEDDNGYLVVERVQIADRKEVQNETNS